MSSHGVSGGGGPRTALIHDFLVSIRGADRVFLEICGLWPEAEIFTPVYDERGTEGRLAGRRVHTSYLQSIRPTSRTFRALLPFYPAAIESFDLSGYDLIISSSSAWAHAVICEESTVHVSYCHNPFRYAWNERQRTLAERIDPISRTMLRGLLRRWREWDWIAAQRVSRYITNSSTTQARIRAYFGRESRIVYPPVATERFAPGEVSNHCLVVSELVSHKRIDVAIEAFNRLGLPLVIVGDGPDRRRLRRMAGPTVRFAGRVGDEKVARLMSSCRALVVTAGEEFGIAAVEAQAAGRPVLARAAGGLLENVVDGVTGRYWQGDAAELVDAVLGFDTTSVEAADCVANARRFDSSVFREAFPREVEAALRDGPPARLESWPRIPRRLPQGRRPGWGSRRLGTG